MATVPGTSVTARYWLKAGDLSGTFANGAEVTSWPNAATGAQPSMIAENTGVKFRSSVAAFSGLPAVEFTTPLASLKTSAAMSLNTGSQTIFAVFSHTDAAGTQLETLLEIMDGVNDGFRIIPRAAGNYPGWHDKVSYQENGESNSNNIFAQGATVVATWSLNASTNLGSIYNHKQLVTPPSTDTFLSGLGFNGTMSLGRDVHTSSWGFDGHLAELIIVDSLLGTTDRNDVEQYLINKYTNDRIYGSTTGVSAMSGEITIEKFVSGTSTSASQVTGAVNVQEAAAGTVYTDTDFSGYAKVVVAVAPPPAGMTVRKIPVVSITMPNIVLDSKGRPT